MIANNKVVERLETASSCLATQGLCKKDSFHCVGVVNSDKVNVRYQKPKKSSPWIMNIQMSTCITIGKDTSFYFCDGINVHTHTHTLHNKRGSL